MALYLITYSTRAPGSSRALISSLNALGGMQWMSGIGCAVWMVQTQLTASDIAAKLWPAFEAESVGASGLPGTMMVTKIGSAGDQARGLSDRRAAWKHHQASITRRRQRGGTK